MVGLDFCYGLVSDIGYVKEYYYDYSENNVSWVISLNTLHSSQESISVPSLGNFEYATAVTNTSLMQDTRDIINLNYFG